MSAHTPGPPDMELIDTFLRDEQIRDAAHDLLEALIKLSNEVLGTLPLIEAFARREFGNTNYNILIQRAEEARAAIAKAEEGRS
jgi:hypothetical protein